MFGNIYVRRRLIAVRDWSDEHKVDLQDNTTYTARIERTAIDTVVLSVFDLSNNLLKERTVTIAEADLSGQPAPAAGWLQKFEYVDGVGICSSAYTWTDKAQGFIDAEEYKYLSPVFSYTPTGEVTGLLCVALTNTPNLDELPALLAAAAQDYRHNT